MQFGYQPGYVFKDLTPSAERLIGLLEIGVPDNQIEELPELTRSSVSEVNSVLNRLAPILISGGTKVKLSAAEIEKKFSELIRIALVTGENPDLVLERRSKNKFFLSDIGRPGLVVAQALSANGIGRIFTNDAKHVNLPDTQLLGHAQTSIGTTRTSSAKQVLSNQTKLELHTRLTDPSYEATDFAILICHEVIPPESYQIWLSRDIPHLAIVFNEKGVRVSPIVIPGETACLGCAEIEKITLDSSWLAIAPQLAENPRNLADTQSLLFAAAVACRAAVSYCDKTNREEFEDSNLGHEFNLSSGEISSFRHAARNCGCRVS